MNIASRDATETRTVNIGQRITVAIGIVIASATSLLAAVGGLEWILDNLALLGTGLGALVTGGLTAFIAVRRMRVDKAARKAGLLLLTAGILSGCVAIRADSSDKGAAVWAFGLGADSSANLANVAVTGPATNAQTGVSFDSGNSEQKSYQAIQSLVQLGAALAPILAGVPAAAPAAAESDTAPAAAVETDAAQADYSADGYGGSPGPAGEGVYGRPSCARCRAYRAAHPDVAIINIDTAANRADMWAALRLRGFSGSGASLPVAVTADAFTLAAR